MKPVSGIGVGLHFLLALFAAAPSWADPVTLSQPGGGGADSCDAILRYGIFDVANLRNENDVEIVYRRWLQHAESSSSSQRGSVSAYLGDVFGGIEGSNDQSKQLAESSGVEAAFRDRSKSTAFLKKASGVIAHAWGECMKNRVGGNVSYRYTVDPRSVDIYLSFKPISEDQPLAKATLRGETVTCTPSSFKKIGANYKISRCRAKSDAGGTVPVQMNVTQNVMSVDIPPVEPIIVTCNKSPVSFVLPANDTTRDSSLPMKIQAAVHGAASCVGDDAVADVMFAYFCQTMPTYPDGSPNWQLFSRQKTGFVRAANGDVLLDATLELDDKPKGQACQIRAEVAYATGAPQFSFLAFAIR